MLPGLKELWPAPDHLFARIPRNSFKTGIDILNKSLPVSNHYGFGGLFQYGFEADLILFGPFPIDFTGEQVADERQKTLLRLGEFNRFPVSCKNETQVMGFYLERYRHTEVNIQLFELFCKDACVRRF
jgi:hypothetical protein